MLRLLSPSSIVKSNSSEWSKETTAMLSLADPCYFSILADAWQYFAVLLEDTKYWKTFISTLWNSSFLRKSKCSSLQATPLPKSLNWQNFQGENEQKEAGEWKDRNTNVFHTERLVTHCPCKPTAGNSCSCLEIDAHELCISFSSHGETKDLNYLDNLHPEGWFLRICVVLKSRKWTVSNFCCWWMLKTPKWKSWKQ